MSNKERRMGIINKLKQSQKPIKGIELGEMFNISRQVIVQDIALLRAEGENIIATPQGYIIPIKRDSKIRKRIVCIHNTYEAIEEELQIMIDHGATIIDVLVEHPRYGEITSVLNISNKKDKEEFINDIIQKKAEPLAILTDGVHIHTIEIDDDKSFEELKKALDEKGYLIKD